jgi:hypothetical protein
VVNILPKLHFFDAIFDHFGGFATLFDADIALFAYFVDRFQIGLRGRDGKIARNQGNSGNNSYQSARKYNGCKSRL